jgi:hypothetical protein
LRRPGEVALLTVIDAVLDVPVGELPGRVALVRRYLGAALDAVPGSRRATFLVIAQMLARMIGNAFALEQQRHSVKLQPCPEASPARQGRLWVARFALCPRGHFPKSRGLLARPFLLRIGCATCGPARPDSTPGLLRHFTSRA